MRKPDFWQALLSLDLSATKSRELLERLGTSCISAHDLFASQALSASERKKLEKLRPLTPNQTALLNPVSLDDSHFPENLKLTQDPPVAIMLRGSISHEDNSAVAIVGTRKASAYGRIIAKKLASELAAGGVTIVSGAAHGVD